MSNKTLVRALVALGFNGGFATSGDEIVLWENAEPQPTNDELVAAGWEPGDGEEGI